MLRHPGELRHRDTVALACRPLSDFVQENHFSAALHRFDVYIRDFRAGLREHREFKVMRREKRVAADPVREFPRDGTRERQTVKG